MRDDCKFEFSFSKVTKEQVLDGVVSVGISGYEVKELITDKVDDVIKILSECKEQGRGKLILTFGGYDYVPEEIYEIAEIREYVSMLFKKYPNLFYFLSDIDMNNKIVLACICDIETVFIGDEKKTISETFYSSGRKSRVGISFDISKELRTEIVNGVIDYAKSINESIDNVKGLLENLFDFTPKENESDDNPFSNVHEAFFETSKQLWKAFIKGSNHTRIDVNGIKNNPGFRNLVSKLINQGFLSVPIYLEKETATNLFVVNDLDYGPVCDNCNTSIAVIIKGELDSDPSVLDKRVFVPSWEYYVNNGIAPFDEEFLKQIPVPINAEKDMWYCPVCGTVHKFTYRDDVGLSY